MANRIWQGHFGMGLVRSPSNFGLRGDAPTHPKLLDWLAEEFIRSGWSIKHLHRLIVLSSTYRQSSSVGAQTRLADPENRFLSHYPRRRLELEPIRDSLLAMTGQLDLQLGGIAEVEMESVYEYSGVRKTAFDSSRRTLYLPINRASPDPVFSTFDYVDPGVSLERRSETIVPHQALFLMNHPLVMESAKRLANRAVSDFQTPDDRIDFIYKSTFSRLPTSEERFVALEFTSTRLQSSGSMTRSESDSSAWSSYRHSLLLTSEFLYVE